MADGSPTPIPTSFEELYEVRRLERRTPTIVELELHPVGDLLAYLPGEYVLRPTRGWLRSARCSRPRSRPAPAAR